MLPPKTPLIVVDMQNGFVNSKSEHVVGPVRTLIEHWIGKSDPVYFTKFINAADSQWQQWLDWHRLQSPPETDIIDARGVPTHPGPSGGWLTKSFMNDPA